MAAGMLGVPGSKYGPCDGECQHRDCAASRRQAGSICRFCGTEIGYETYFYQDGEAQDGAGEPNFVHAICLEKALEAK